MTKNTATISSGVNWLGAPGAACAQASDIKPFICRFRGAKRAALCHSVGAAPGRSKGPRPGLEAAGLDGRPQRAQQLQVKMQVVDRVEARTEDLIAAIQVAQVGAAVVAAGVAGTGGVHGRQVFLVDAVADVDHT